MATFLARALELTPTTPFFSDVGPGTHSGNIGAIAAAGITTGCGVGLYCPFGAVTREQMASFLSRAFGFAPIYPQIEVVAGRFPWCSKDGLVCYVSITVPLLSKYEIREGFYDLRRRPRSSNHRQPSSQLTLNGQVLGVTDLGVSTAGVARLRSFQAITGLSPGTHTLVVGWYWNGFLEQTTNVIITVRP